MDDIVKDFLIESGENLDRVDQELVKLEADPASKELLGSIFRAIHSVKGSCGFLGFSRLEKVAHAGESLLSRLRDGELALTAEITSGLLAMVDAVRKMLSAIGASGQDGEDDYPELRERLKKLQESKPAGEANSARSGPESTSGAAASPVEPPAASDAAGAEPGDASRSSYLPAPGKTGALLVERGVVQSEELATALREQELGDRRRLGEILVALGICKQEEVAAALNILAARGRDAAVETVRVGVHRLDKMMNLVGELVLARNQLLRFTTSTKDLGLRAISQRMNLIAAELQEEVMKTRMQPIGNVWSKFPRTVRDLALSCSKQVRLVMEGRDTELDRTIIEAIKDPLTHLVRNAVDHGIEPPEVRTKSGKDATGVLTLRAFHERGQVNIEISDDGAAANIDRIRKKALERGLITERQAARMPDRDVLNLLFLPGFSTAETVTNISGRGVGMDVVKTNLEKIGGTVDIRSAAGRGTTVAIKIPLTLAIVPALIVRCNGERFAIPQVSLTELVRVDSNKGIEKAQGAPVYRLRGRLLPLVHLHDVLGMQSRPGKDSSEADAPEGIEFAAAKEKHLRWLARLEEMLREKITIPIEEAGSPTSCSLGRWLYHEGLRLYPDLTELRILEQTHRKFHERVREVVVANVNGFRERAQEMYGGLAPLTQEIVALLDTVEQKRALALANVNIAVLQTESRQFGLMVDDILNTEEIVVKPLAKQLKGLSTYSGATIMGDGGVALILDVKGLAARAGIVADMQDFGPEETTTSRQPGSEAKPRENRLMVLGRQRDGSQLAIPLGVVARLEEFPDSVIQRAGNLEVMQYRGHIIPLLRLSRFLPGMSDATAEVQKSIQVIVCSHRGRTTGLLVDRIVDIVEQTTDLESVEKRQGVTGTCMIHEKVTDVLDIPAIVSVAVPDYLAAAEPGS